MSLCTFRMSPKTMLISNYLYSAFLVPVFVIGLYGLYHNKRSIYPLMAIYGATATTTTLACVVHVLITPNALPPSATAVLPTGPTLTYEQRMMLLSSYVPFCILPFMIAIDFGVRLTKLVNKAVKAEQKWD